MKRWMDYQFSGDFQPCRNLKVLTNPPPSGNTMKTGCAVPTPGSSAASRIIRKKSSASCFSGLLSMRPMAMRRHCVISSMGRKEGRGSESHYFMVFLENIVEQDVSGALERIVWEEFSGPIRVLLNNHYVFHPFWKSVWYGSRIMASTSSPNRRPDILDPEAVLRYICDYISSNRTPSEVAVTLTLPVILGFESAVSVNTGTQARPSLRAEAV